MGKKKKEKSSADSNTFFKNGRRHGQFYVRFRKLNENNKFLEYNLPKSWPKEAAEI